ncbi:MAG: P-II family nitrogen regulator [Candidatus Omnitrophica bacterium]|nr:P-II family nitrogen regulator [Candidatus Omnitrophota bacterium]
MKKIEVIIRPTKVGDVCTALDRAGHPGIMITEIEGHGKQKGIEQKVRGKTYKVDLITKARIEIVVKDGDVDNIVKAVREAAFTGEVGDGKIFIYPVADAVRIRTAERGDIAV